MILLEGEFTVPVSGLWRVSHSCTASTGKGNSNNIEVIHKGKSIKGSRSGSYQSAGGDIWTSVAREVFIRAEQDDTIYVKAGTVDGTFLFISACFEFVSP